MSIHVDALADEVFTAAAAQNRAGTASARYPFGEVIANPEYPDLFFVNCVIDLRAPTWSVDRLERELTQAIPHAPYLRAASRDPATREQLGPRLVRAGYSHEFRVAMVQVQVAEPSRLPDSRFPIVRVETRSAWQDFERLMTRDLFEARWSDAMIGQLLRLYRWRAANLPQRFYLAFEASAPVGTVSVFQHGFIGYLTSLLVDGAARGRGAGSTLVLRMGAEARAMGCERLTLQCTGDSFLPGFYERLGFRVVGEEHSWMRRR